MCVLIEYLQGDDINGQCEEQTCVFRDWKRISPDCSVINKMSDI